MKSSGRKRRKRRGSEALHLQLNENVDRVVGVFAVNKMAFCQLDESKKRLSIKGESAEAVVCAFPDQGNRKDSRFWARKGEQIYSFPWRQPAFVQRQRVPPGLNVYSAPSASPGTRWNVPCVRQCGAVYFCTLMPLVVSTAPASPRY